MKTEKKKHYSLTGDLKIRTNQVNVASNQELNTVNFAVYVDDLKKLYDSALAGRYGKNGSKAVWQFLKEQNPTLDAGLYRQIRQVIESGRNNFEANQTMLIDKKRTYETSLKRFPNNVIAGFLGFPKIDLTKYDIVTSDTTEEAFKTKKSEPFKLR